MPGSESLETAAVRFRLHGRLAHFARAETQTTVLSYPVPPRTALVGLAGAVLGMSKDTAPVLLASAQIAVTGKAAKSHWHTAKLRKDPPEALPRRVSASQRMEKATRHEKAGLITQEWLLDPEYTVWMALPAPYQEALAERLRERRWHFSPCLGLSEMTASLSDVDECAITKLPVGRYSVRTVFPKDQAEVDVADALERSLGLGIVSMPHSVSADRVFRHRHYVLEVAGTEVQLRSPHAWRANDEVILFL